MKKRLKMQTRIEHDTMGDVEVPREAMWGAQTQRSEENFKIGTEHMPRPMIRAMGLVKKAAAITNASLNQIPHDLSQYIVDAADEVISGKWDSYRQSKTRQSIRFTKACASE